MTGPSEFSPHPVNDANHGIRQAKQSTIDLVAGGVGATVSVYVGQPLDTVKVKLQTFPKFYTGMVQCFSNTFKSEGIRGLYAGTLPALTANIAENSILFAAYGLCQKGVAATLGVQKVEEMSTFQNALSGFFAAFFPTLVLCPTELIKCKLQAMREVSLAQQAAGGTPPTERMTPIRLTRNILRTEGVPGLFRGFTSTLTREMPGYFVFFGAYEACREIVKPVGKTKEEISPLQTVFCGGMAGVALWTAVFPADVIKSRIQVSGSTEPMMKVFFKIKRTEGIRALYSGLTPTIIRSFPATGALFLTYEFTKKKLGEMAL